MSDNKIRVAVLAGAKSTEHEVSLASAFNIVNSIDRDKYEVFVIGIDPTGVWRQYEPDNFVSDPTDFKKIKLAEPISGRVGITQSSNAFYDLDNGLELFRVDVVFNAILGNNAEDGTMQGLLRIMDVPFTTPDVLGSAIAMDKDVMRRLFEQAGIPTTKSVMIRKNASRPSYSELVEQLGSTLFVKPANNGSSVGVYRVTNGEEFEKYVEKAFSYDVKILVEEENIGREVEISVLGNIGGIRASTAVGEIVPNEGDFYSYNNKYIQSDNCSLLAPADVSEKQLAEMQALAVKVMEALECEGFSRIDFFILEKDEKLIVNEINTMPGFTKISMFPRLWQESGLTYPELVDQILQLAIERHEYRIAPIVTDASEVLIRESQ